MPAPCPNASWKSSKYRRLPRALQLFRRKHLISLSNGLNEFFESGRPFPHTLDIELAPSGRRSLTRYVLVTGNHGIHGDDSILKMPRAWIVSGSNDAASWAV